MNVLWLLGTFTFATVIGIIGEDVTNTIMVQHLTLLSACVTFLVLLPLMQSHIEQHICPASEC